nr:MAG TPA: hypothetical protein [Caudoviricetes sp.]
MDNKESKQLKILELIIQAVIALATLITAIKS